MENLELKYESAKKSVDSLKELIYLIEKETSNINLSFIDSEKLDKIFRDSLIQRFEYSVDTLWKFLKEYFLQHKGIELQSPKPIFRYCLTAKFITEEETIVLIEMIDSRNLTSHTYKEPLAEKIAKAIPKYCELMEKILKKTGL